MQLFRSISLRSSTAPPTDRLSGNGSPGNGSEPQPAEPADAGGGSGGGGGGGGGAEGPLSVFDALAEFFMEQRLDGKCYRCESCSSMEHARKGALLLTRPPLLVLHMKRFRRADSSTPHLALRRRAAPSPTRSPLPTPLTPSPLARSYGTTAKKGMDPLVTPPVLDLSPFAAGADEHTSPVYDLVALVQHHGIGPTSGHYTAFVRTFPSGRPTAAGRGSRSRRRRHEKEAEEEMEVDEDGVESRWFHCDDRRVTPCSAADALGAEAYLLFYVRRQGGEHAAQRRAVLDALARHAGLGGAQNADAGAELDAVNEALERSHRSAEPAGCAADEPLLSRGWLARFLATDEPGALTHSDALCPHDCVDLDAQPPVDARHGLTLADARACFVPCHASLWAELETRFRAAAPAAPPVPRLVHCDVCRQTHADEARGRQLEKEEIESLDSTEISPGGIWYLVDASWLKHWREYCWENTRPDPPGPVSNWRLLVSGRPKPFLQR